VQTDVYSSPPATAESLSVIGATAPAPAGYAKDILTIGEVAEILRCSRNHVSNVNERKSAARTRFTHLYWAGGSSTGASG
jgi:hypothetical protein